MGTGGKWGQYIVSMPLLNTLPSCKGGSEKTIYCPHLRRESCRSPDRSCDLLLKATRGVTIAVVSSRERKRRQPGLATDDPAFVGWHQLVRGIQGSYVHFDFVCAASENGRAA